MNKKKLKKNDYSKMMKKSKDFSSFNSRLYLIQFFKKFTVLSDILDEEAVSPTNTLVYLGQQDTNNLEPWIKYKQHSTVFERLYKSISYNFYASYATFL